MNNLTRMVIRKDYQQCLCNKHIFSSVHSNYQDIPNNITCTCSYKANENSLIFYNPNFEDLTKIKDLLLRSYKTRAPFNLRKGFIYQFFLTRKYYQQYLFCLFTELQEYLYLDINSTDNQVDKMKMNHTQYYQPIFEKLKVEHGISLETFLENVNPLFTINMTNGLPFIKQKLKSKSKAYIIPIIDPKVIENHD